MIRRSHRRLRRSLTVAVLFLVLAAVGVVSVLRILYPLPAEYRESVETAAEKYDLPPSLIWAVIHTESGFSPDARSSAEAIGLMQITAPTMEWALMRSGVTTVPSEEALTDPAFNIEIGTCVLHLLSEQFSEQDTVLAAYNAGMGTVRKWLGDTAYSADGKTLHTIPFKETAKYVTRVHRAQTIYQTLYGVDR